MRDLLGKCAALLLAAAVAACGPGARGGDDDGGGGGGDDGGGDDVPDGGDPGDGCADSAKLIYTVDSNRQLSTFDPQTKTFSNLGLLSCPAGGGATPFSMGIARDATAWVLYSNGELFRVQTTSGLPCVKAAWTRNTDGHAVFGMGFSTDAAGGSTDTLFIAGGTGPSVPTSKLARLELTSFQPTTVGSVTGWPELTGTGNAELWGFFPTDNGARIVRLDKANGSALQTHQLPSLAGNPTAWAFAFHGGDFWVFLKKNLELDTTVYQVNGSTGAITGMTRANGRSIVGAGVSTCAPVIL